MVKSLCITLLSSIIYVFSTFPALAQEPVMIGEVKIWTSSEIPNGWIICDGRLLAIAEYPELYAIIEGTFGTSGSNFRVPNLLGKVPIMRNTSESEFAVIGQSGGAKTHTLTTAQMPVHTHDVGYRRNIYQTGNVADALTSVPGENPVVVSDPTGGGQPHNNLQPYLTMLYIIHAKDTSEEIMTEPITNTTRITVQFTNTTGISITTTPIKTNTTATTGTIYIPYTFQSMATYDPYRILSSLMIFLAIGVMIKKPTAFILVWIGLTITGIFSLPGVFWYWTAILLIALFMLYHLFTTFTRTR